jgi:hypothetical protein
MVQNLAERVPQQRADIEAARAEDALRVDDDQAAVRLA